MEKKNNKQGFLLLLTIIMFIGISFGAVYFISNIEDSRANVLQTGLVKINFTEGDVINLTSVVPVVDEIGLTNEAYQFSVTNTSSIPVKMKISFLEDSSNTLPIEAIRYGFYVDGELVSKDSLANLDSENNFLVYDNFLASKTLTCKLVLWVDYYYSASTSETFSGKIKIISEGSDNIAK